MASKLGKRNFFSISLFTFVLFAGYCSMSFAQQQPVTTKTAQQIAPLLKSKVQGFIENQILTIGATQFKSDMVDTSVYYNGNTGLEVDISARYKVPKIEAEAFVKCSMEIILTINGTQATITDVPYQTGSGIVNPPSQIPFYRPQLEAAKAICHDLWPAVMRKNIPALATSLLK